jgi:hypothetical protein
MNRWIVFCLLAPLLSVSGAGVLTVVPNSADPGETVSVTMSIDGGATPPPPPSGVMPGSMLIGNIVGSSISRSGNDCTANFTIPAGQAAGALDCKVVFTTPNGDLEMSLVDGFTVNVDATAPPTITGDPEMLNVVLGGAGSFTVSATGADPLSYQWQFDGVNVAGATSAIYSIASVAALNAGGYQCVVTNPNGSATSAAAMLTVLDLSAALERPYVIVDTGQRKSYNNTAVMAKPAEGADFYGQDANYIGNQPIYVTGADGKSVYDYHTGLTWTQTPDLNADGTIDVDDKLTQPEAAAYVATLNAANFGGFNDWRLPSIKEIYSLMDFRGTDPTSDDTSTMVPFIDTEYFDFGYGDTDAGERTIDAQLATTSIYVDTVMSGQTAMFGLNLADGRIKGYGLNNIDFYVLYVRGNADYGVNDFEDNTDLTVTDNATGLMWQKDDSGSGMLWKDALAYAEAATHAGHDDWRLPNAKELQSLFDYTRSPGTTSSPAIDAIFTSTQITNEGGQVDYPWYYTGTTHANQDGAGKAAVYMCFGRSTGYFNSAWTDVHGAGAQRSESKAYDTTGYTYEADGWYFTIAPQGDSARWYNYVRLVRDAPVAINTAPTFSLSGDVDATSGEVVSIENFAVVSGLADGESVLSYTVTAEPSEHFIVLPAISTDGTLTFTAQDSKIFLSTEVTVTVQDDGGTASGGVDTSAEQTFIITGHADYHVIQAAFDPHAYDSLGALELLATDTIEIDTDAGTMTGATTYTSTVVDADMSGTNYRVFCFDLVDIPAGAIVNISGSLPIAILARGDFNLAGLMNASGADGVDGASGVTGTAGGDAGWISLVSDRSLTIAGVVTAAGGDGGQGGDTSGTFPVDLVVEGAGGAGGDGGIITLAADELEVTGPIDVSGGDAGDVGAANGIIAAPMGADGGTAGNVYVLNTATTSITADVSHGSGGSGVPSGMSGEPIGPDSEDYGQTYFIGTPSYLGVVLYHVDTSRSGSAASTQDGLGWATAFADLQAALACAVAADEIWVAAGVYYPDEAEAGVATVMADSASSTFQLIEGVSVYGGFVGTETERTARDWDANVTILSGDIDQNDTKVDDVVVITPEVNIAGTNAKTVVHGILTMDTLLDGVIVTAGSGGDAGGIFGGGTFRRCVIQGNYGVSAGGIRHEPYEDDEAYTLIECDILANTGGTTGGVAAYSVSTFVMTSCRVQGNTATGTNSNVGVGGVQLGQGDVTLTNCIVSGNVGYHNGGIVMRSSGSLIIYNSTVTGNYATETTQASTTGGIDIESGAYFEFRNGILWGNASAQADNFTTTTTPAIYNSIVEDYNLGSGFDGTDPASAPLFLTSLTASATASTAGDFRLDGSSYLVDGGDESNFVNDVSDLDEDGDTGEDLPYDIADNDRINNDLDIGAYEYVGPQVPSSISETLQLDVDSVGMVELLDLDTVFAESGLSYAITSITAAVINPQIIGSIFSASVYAGVGSVATVTVAATDADGNQASTTFTVTITEVLSALETYRDDYLLYEDGSEDFVDGSGNGVVTILYFAFNLGDPGGVSVAIPDADLGNGTMGLPALSISDAGDSWLFTYVRYAGENSGISYEAQVSYDLVSWPSVSREEGLLLSTTITPYDADYEFVTLEFEQIDATFFRVEVGVDALP